MQVRTTIGFTKARALLALGIGLLSATPASAAGMFTGLGVVTGQHASSTAWAVSADGRVAVGTAGGQAARWTRETGLVAIGGSPAGAAEAYGVSADGSVVVGRMRLSSNSFEAFRWTEAGGMVGLGSLSDGNTWSHGRDVSADGSVVVGYTRVPGSSAANAFRWTEDGGMVALGTLPGSNQSLGHGVSAGGDFVVGGWIFGEPFRWSEGTGMQSLGLLPGGADATALSITADGSVVVGYSDSALGTQAFLWTEADGMIGLGDLPGGRFSSTALDVTADGSVAVGFGYRTESSATAMIWDAAAGMRNLEDVLENDHGIDLQGWTLHQATGISADGRTIVGVGTHNGRTEGWVFVPEPPGGLLWLAILAPGFGLRHRLGRSKAYRAIPGK